ncbi:MAG: glycosyl transferase family 2 [Cyanobacteria bacterium RYN_339]|nr:glycosyl transferase family 2 [Cyanobacteria bacterium RYN_339]
MLTTLVVALLAIIQAYALYAALYTYYPMAGALLGRFRPANEQPTPDAPPPRLAVLIAAHNEEAVIGGAVTSLMQQRYPRGGFDVFVVADNCRDATAAIARRAGATVYERFNGGGSTKGQALAWMWGYVRQFGYGGVVVLDADNQADESFLTTIATELGRGHQAVQGIRRPKNEDAGGTAGLDALTELCTHRIGAAGRQRLGLNGPLMGSGVGYAAGLFDELILSTGDTVVEDCEWQARLALRKIAITWTDRAIIYDEKTSRADAMATQRDRWMAGRGQVAREYLGPCVRAFFREGNLNALDMAAYLTTPPRILMLAMLGLLFLAALAGLPGVWPALIWFLGLAGFVAYVFLGLWLDGAPASAYRRLGLGVLHLPRFTYNMVRSTWKAVSGAAVKWVPTPHGNGARG